MATTFDIPNAGNPQDVTTVADISTITSATPKGSLIPKPVLPADTAPVNQMMSYTDIINQSQQDLANTQASRNQEMIDQSIKRYLGLDGGVGVAERKQEEINAINEKFDVSGTSARLAKIKADIEANKLSAEGQKQGIGQNTGGLTEADIAGFGEQIDRRIASKNLALSAEGLALQGNLAAAKSAIESSVDAKYAPIEAKYKAILEYNKLNETALGREAEKQQQRANAKLKELEAKKKAEEEIGLMIAEAIPNAPEDVISRAKKLSESGASKLAVAQTLGKYGGDYLGDLVKRTSIAKNQAEYDKTIAEIKALKTPVTNPAPVGSNAHSTNSWVNSAVNKESLSAGEREKISKSFAVVGQLGNLATALQKDQTSFFGGKVREIKASLGADADAGTIQAQITALVPQVARGVFGEVGVLTDADIANYKKVIGNLTAPNAQNAAVTAMTLTALRNGVKSQLDTAAASKLDVSRFVPLYQDLTNQINTVNDEIGVSDLQVREYMLRNPQTQPMIEALITEGRKGSEILQILGVEH